MSGIIPQPLEELITLLARLPGIGERTATRLAFRILNGDPVFADALGRSLSSVHSRILRCQICGYFDHESTCGICRDQRREESTICVVASVQDVMAIERAGGFRGRYHVLHGLLAPLEGIGPDDLPLDGLLKRISEEVQELVIATPLSVEGEATAHLLAQVVRRDFGERVKLSRIASGMPHGGELEYTDQITLGRAFDGRTPI